MHWVFWWDISGEKVDSWEVDMGCWGHGEHITQRGDELLRLYLRTRSGEGDIRGRETSEWAGKDSKKGKNNLNEL